MLSFLPDLVEPLERLEITCPTEKVTFCKTLSKIQLVACLEALEHASFSIEPLRDIIVAYSICPVSMQLLEAAEKASRNNLFVADDLCAESFHPDAPRSVLACIQRHVANPAFQEDPHRYMEQLNRTVAPTDGLESRAIAFMNEHIQQ